MPSDDWCPSTLGELIDVKHGFAFKGECFRDEPTADVLLTPGNFAIGGGIKTDKFKYYDGPVPSEFVLESGDLLVTMTDLSRSADTLGFPAFVPQGKHARYLHNQRLGKVVIKPAAPLDKRFLYYLFCSKQYRDEVLASATGTTVKHTSPERIKRFSTWLPPVREQRAIAHILGTLDDKIELNRRMNETLESMARAIFKSWFVDFDPVRVKAEGRQPAGMDAGMAALFPSCFTRSEVGAIPSGWCPRRWGEIATLEYGKSLRTHGNSCGTFRVYGTNGPIGWHTEPLCNGAGVIIGRKGAYRGVHYSPRPFFVIDTAFYLRPKGHLNLIWAYYELSTMDINRMDSGSAIPSTSREDFYQMPVILAPPSVLDAFGKSVQPFFDLIVAKNHECETLAAVRDALVPRLLSGEIRTGDLKEVLDRVDEQPSQTGQ